jgi:hypothetical protein
MQQTALLCSDHQFQARATIDVSLPTVALRRVAVNGCL